MISVTEQAAKKIKQFIARRGHGIGIKVGVRTTGCSGLAYVLEYVDTQFDGDDTIAQDGFSVIINRKDQPYLLGIVIDYKRNGLNEGFEFINKNERGRCGCGISFRV
jgi:iron-sulfur cluster assembly protein